MWRAPERFRWSDHPNTIFALMLLSLAGLALVWSRVVVASAFVHYTGKTLPAAYHAARTTRRRRVSARSKRLFDITVSLVALFLTAPTMLMIAIMVRLTIGGPVIFKQRRPGLHGKPFTMYKFRTMTDARDADGNLLPDAARLTPFGKLLRKTSLDELPELINVLKGDMSLVGPRPLLMRYLSLYTPEQARRHDVKPGITGWAQVNGRNGLSWEEKFALDLFYVENVTLWMDLRILFKTVLVILRRDGVNQEGQATCAPFTGTLISSETASRPHPEIADQQIA